MYICIYVHIYMYICIDVFLRTYIYVDIYMYTYIWRATEKVAATGEERQEYTYKCVFVSKFNQLLGCGVIYWFVEKAGHEEGARQVKGSTIGGGETGCLYDLSVRVHVSEHVCTCSCSLSASICVCLCLCLSVSISVCASWIIHAHSYVSRDPIICFITFKVHYQGCHSHVWHGSCM